MHAQGARDLKLGAGGNGAGLTSECGPKIPIGIASFCCDVLVEGVHGGTSASTQSERVRLTCQETRLSICDRDRRLGMCEICAHMKPLSSPRPEAQSSIWSSTQLAREMSLELMARSNCTAHMKGMVGAQRQQHSPDESSHPEHGLADHRQWAGAAFGPRGGSLHKSSIRDPRM